MRILLNLILAFFFLLWPSIFGEVSYLLLMLVGALTTTVLGVYYGLKAVHELIDFVVGKIKRG